MRFAPPVFKTGSLNQLRHSSKYVWGEEGYFFSHELDGVLVHGIRIQPKQISNMAMHNLQSVRIGFRHKPLIAIQMKLLDDFPLLDSWSFPVFQRRNPPSIVFLLYAYYLDFIAAFEKNFLLAFELF